MSVLKTEGLNERLAKWRWPNGERLAFMPSTDDILWGTKEEQYWVNFPKSLNDIFRWLVPEACRRFPIRCISFVYGDEGGIACLIEMVNYSVVRSDKFELNEALALCKAIEKLIGE